MADQIMTRFGALDRELAEAVLHTMILVARDGVHALDDVHRRLGWSIAVDGPAWAEPPGERWRSLLGELFRIQVDHDDPPAAVACRPPGGCRDDRTVAVVGRLVGAAGAFLTAESLVFEERVELLVPGPGELDPAKLRCLLDRASAVADEVLDHADQGGWIVLVERYRVPEQPQPASSAAADGRNALPVLVLADQALPHDVALTVHRQIVAVARRDGDREIDVRLQSDQHLHAVLEVARHRTCGEPDPRIRFRRVPGGPPLPGVPHPVASQLRQLARGDCPPRPGYVILVSGATGTLLAATQANWRLALLDLDLQGLLPDLDGWSVTCVNTGSGPAAERNVGYLRELCLAGGARSFDVVGVQARLPQPSRTRARAVVPPEERRGPRPVVTGLLPPPPPRRFDASGREERLRARIRQVRWQSAQVMEGHVVGPHGQNLTVREAQARADLLGGLIEVEQGQGSLRHRRIPRFARILAVLTVVLFDLPIMLWLTTSGFTTALAAPTWLSAVAGGLLALLATGGGAVGLHQLGRNQRQYKDSGRRLGWGLLPASTKRVLIGVTALAVTMGAVAAARVYTAAGPAPVGWLVAGAVGGVLIGSAGWLFWGAFRDGSLEQDELRHYRESVRPLLLQKQRHDREELELRREYQHLAGSGERGEDADPTLDDLRRRAGDPTDAQLTDRSLGEHGTSLALLAYAERWNVTENCRELLTMVREQSGHRRGLPSDEGTAAGDQITAGTEQ
ncbi:hypothetical protein [Amycolatopsis sp. NPDC021455]|uniref:hypothetical protein n=1 Tax=Amycolatopsis sp. NPDC021455 TaxID=3154901 RepID=UPI00340B132A